MKICIIQGAFLPVPPIQGGAVEKIWFKMGSEFVKRGHEVLHISKRCMGLNNQEMIDGVSHTRVKGYDTPASLAVLKLLDLFYTVRALLVVPRDADVIVTNTFWAPFLIRGTRAKKVYVDVQRVPKGQMKFYKHVGVLRGCSPAICAAVKDEIAEEFHPMVSYIPNPVPFEVSDVVREKEKIILFVGRIHQEKGVNVLIDAFKRFPRNLLKDWRLLIVGPWETKDGGGGDEYWNAVKKTADGLPIEFIGPIFDEKRLKDFFATASIFCYPAQAGSGDAAPVAPREAMAYGCVPVVSLLPCFDDFIHDNVNGIRYNHLASDQATELSNALHSLAEDKDRLGRLEVEAKRVMDYYSSSAVADAFLEDFSKRILSKK